MTEPQLAADPVTVLAEPGEALEQLSPTHAIAGGGIGRPDTLRAMNGVSVRASVRDLGVWLKTIRIGGNDCGGLRTDNGLPPMYRAVVAATLGTVPPHNLAGSVATHFFAAPGEGHIR
jgi:hypothetical protein